MAWLQASGLQGERGRPYIPSDQAILPFATFEEEEWTTLSSHTPMQSAVFER